MQERADEVMIATGWESGKLIQGYWFSAGSGHKCLTGRHREFKYLPN